MKKTMKLFAVLCGGALALFAACAHDSGSEPTKYTVTFNSNGGSDVAPQSVESGKRAIEPKDPTKDGVTFGGWYDGENLFCFTTTAIISNITLTAKWIGGQYEAGDVKLTFYDDGTFEYTDKDGTTWRGAYEMSGDGKITGEIEGKDGDSSLEVDTSGDSPSVSVGGEELDLEFEDTTPENTTGGSGPSGGNNGGSGGDGNIGSADAYEPGATIEMGGITYLVVKNTEMSGVAPQNSTLGYYPNSRADLYRDHLLERCGVQEPYVIVFNTETAEKKIGSTSSYDDEYRILRDGKKYYRIRYRWENRIIDFANKTTYDLRWDYDPSCFVVDNDTAAYETDLSKKIYHNYKFEYAQDGKTIAYSDDNWREYEYFKDYMYIVATKKERNQYEIIDRISNKARSYKLRNPNDTDTGNSNNFFEFRVDFAENGSTPKLYRLIATGSGTVQYVSSSYTNTIRISDLEYFSADSRNVYFTVDAGNGSYVAFDDLYEREESEYEDDGKGNDSWSSPSDDKDSSSGGSSSTGNVSDKGGDSVTNTKVYAATLVTKNEGVGKYVKVSDTTTSVNGIIVPTLITFAVPFADENAPLGKFTTVTFVPKAKDNYVIYVPKEGSKSDYEFIDNYKSGYGIFGEYSTTRPAS